ncbi:unnamed protein product [Microthlaspi erraticum]|uniref:F-box domain-containing protein n=1 Tax=Microthlaspi erraticum TaxID=1685480 RepID=A0A6D2K111_9BRAS|nr:unnamed protein product [Microthlaspi erraticum]
MMELKRKKWQSKLQHTKMQVLHRCLAAFSRVLSFRKKQEKSGINPSFNETTLAIVTQPMSMGIPEELVEEILQHLPVKSLVRFKSVSKRWRSVIDSSHLQVKHLRIRHKNYGDKEKNIVFEKEKSGGFQVTTCSKHIKFCSPLSCYCYRVREEDTTIRVAGSCNGLVCVYDLVHVYIINPATRRTRRLDPPISLKGKRLSMGFGRDVETGTYKVVVVYSFDCGNSIEALVFDLGESEWRRRYETAGPIPECSLSFTVFNPHRKALFVNGSLVWSMTRVDKGILVMDLHTEKIRKIHYPDGCLKGHVHISNLNDRLCVSQLSEGPDSEALVLLEDEPIERWERIVPFQIPPLSLNSTWFTQTLLSP